MYTIYIKTIFLFFFLKQCFYYFYFFCISKPPLFNVVFHDSLFTYNTLCSEQYVLPLIPTTRLTSSPAPSPVFFFLKSEIQRFWHQRFQIRVRDCGPMCVCVCIIIIFFLHFYVLIPHRVQKLILKSGLLG